MEKITNRKCQSCNVVKDRSEMIKITLNKGSLIINPDSKTVGRSAYVCKNLDCIKLLIKKKRLFRALKFKNLEEISKIEAELPELL